MQRRRLIPLPPLRRYATADLRADLRAALTVLFLAVPQGLAYATIAGLPPATGLYAAAIPTIVSAVFRSSSHVISGPSNALSLLVGAAIGHATGIDPTQVALTLAVLVGLLQVAAGVLRLGALVDFISSAVVLGYIAGAGILIGLGQLHNATGTHGPSGRPWVTIGGWLEAVGATEPVAVAFAAGTLAIIVGVRLLNARLGWRLPAAIVAMAAALATNLAFDLETRGLRVLADIAPIPVGLPPLTVPDLSHAPMLLTAAIACAVLSLVESSSVARSIAARTGQQLDASTEFFGQGMSNLAAAFFGGYPVSGSLARSALNESAGARTRVAGMVGGVLMVVVLLALGPVLDHTPVASLAGTLFVIAYDLIDIKRIRQVVRASRADALAFAATLVGTQLVSLDRAIYLGVGISIVLFLRRARLIRVLELVAGNDAILHERPIGGAKPHERTCERIRILHVEGPLFFGVAGELRDALTTVAAPDHVRALVVRLKRASGLDATTSAALVELATALRRADKHLVLAGITPGDFAVLERSGAVDTIGRANLFPSLDRSFSALQAAIGHAQTLVEAPCETCPLRGVTRPGSLLASPGGGPATRKPGAP